MCVSPMITAVSQCKAMSLVVNRSLFAANGLPRKAEPRWCHEKLREGHNSSGGHNAENSVFKAFNRKTNYRVCKVKKF